MAFDEFLCRTGETGAPCESIHSANLPAAVL
jgi:hypothetical protein